MSAVVASPLDIRVAEVLGRSARAFQPDPNLAPAQHGQYFEQAVFRTLLAEGAFTRVGGPDQFDMSLHISSRTGIRYEFDGAFATPQTLYVVEAKTSIGRGDVGAFTLKLLDVMLGAHAELRRLAVMPVLVCYTDRVTRAARQYAASWGILLVSRNYPTPHELLSIIRAVGASPPLPESFQDLQSTCLTLSGRLWRPFGAVVSGPDGANRFTLDASAIYDWQQVGPLLTEWRECVALARSLAIWREP